MGSPTKIVSFSELDAARQCPLKHYLSYREGWSPPTDPIALARGSLFHKVMELHYTRLKEGVKLPGIVQEIQASNLLVDQESGESTEMQDNVAWMYIGYVREYGADEDWDIQAVEWKLGEWLPTEKGTRSTFKLVGTVDLIVRDNSAGGGLWLVDHKTCKNLPRGKELDLDDQMGTYIFLMRRRGIDIRGAIYNSVRHQKLKTREMGSDERFQRRLTVRTDGEVKTMALEVLDAFRDIYRPKKERTLPRRTPDQERCGWKCGYTEPCLASRKAHNDADLLHSMLEDHEFVRDERGTTRERYKDYI